MKEDKVPNCWTSRPHEVQARLLRLADDEDWWVREEAHSTLGGLFTAHFDILYPILLSWTRHPSANVRRSVAIAVREAANDRKGRPETVRWGFGQKRPPSPWITFLALRVIKRIFM